MPTLSLPIKAYHVQGITNVKKPPIMGLTGPCAYVAVSMVTMSKRLVTSAAEKSPFPCHCKAFPS